MPRPTRRGGAGLLRRPSEGTRDASYSHLDRTTEAIGAADTRWLRAAGIEKRNRRRFGDAYRVGTVGPEGGRPARG